MRVFEEIKKACFLDTDFRPEKTSRQFLLNSFITIVFPFFFTKCYKLKF